MVKIFSVLVSITLNLIINSIHCHYSGSVFNYFWARVHKSSIVRDTPAKLWYRILHITNVVYLTRATPPESSN